MIEAFYEKVSMKKKGRKTGKSWEAGDIFIVGIVGPVGGWLIARGCLAGLRQAVGGGRMVVA